MTRDVVGNDEGAGEPGREISENRLQCRDTAGRHPENDDGERRVTLVARDPRSRLVAMCGSRHTGTMSGNKHRRNRPSREPEGENLLLRRLPAADHARIAGDLEPVSLEFKETLYEDGKQITHVYFPTTSMASLVTVSINGGEPVEAGTAGDEGMVGLAAFLEAPRAFGRALCQIPGDAWRMTADRFAAAVACSDSLRHLMLRYTHAVTAMMAQGVACNRWHDTRARMARWLLTTHDRVHRDSFPLTQEFLGQMLGVRRPAVSLAGTSLQSDGLIRYARGKITIVDRAGLERTSCECYGQIRDEFAVSFPRGRASGVVPRPGAGISDTRAQPSRRTGPTG